MPGLSGVRLGLCSVAVCLSLPAWSAAAWRFDIEPQSLSSALASFARQSGLQLVYYSELTDRQRSPALKGDFTIDDALSRLLAGSGLAFALLDERTVVIEPGRQPDDVGTVRDAAPLVATTVNPTREPPPKTEVRTVLEEVMVTARRREENLQQVPISVTALAAEQLEARSIDNTETLNRQLTNVSVAGANFFGRQSGVFRMRGIPGVAVYVDGVVHGGSAGALQNVVEVERIEVMRGPQGTLFGKNAVGGAIQYISQKPREDFGARVKASVGSYGRADLTANVDVPLGETLLTKLTAARLSREGYLPSTTVQQEFGSQDDSVGRLVLAWRPQDALSLLFIGEYSEQRTNGNPSTVWSLNPVCAGEQLPANYLGAVPNNPCIYEAVGLPIPQEWVYGARDERKTASDYRGPDLFTTAKGAKSEANLRLTQTWALKGIAGYRAVDSTGYADFDGTPYKLFDGQNYNERREKSAELQALYAGERLRGTTGLYYYDDRTRGRRMNWPANELHPQVNPALNAAALAYFPDFGTPGNASAFVFDGLSYNTSEGWAIFAEWMFDVTARFTITAGARYNHDRITTAAYPTVDSLDVRCCVPSFNVDAGGPAIANQSGSATFTELSPRVSLQYQWTPQVMTYFTYSEGFGAGGFSGGNIPDVPNGGFSSYGPELLKNYEIGLRSDLFAGRLRFNLSAFYGQYDDIQVMEEVIPRFPTTSNAGEAEIHGIEVEGIWSPSAAFALNYGFGWLDTAYTDLGQVKNIRLDSPFAYSPRYSYALGAQYTWRTDEGGQITLRGDYGWQDEVIATLDFNTGSVIPAYGLASARIAYKPPAGRWDVAVFGSNLSNEYYRINGFFIPFDQMDNGTVGRPREWGVTFSFAFE